MKTNKQALRKEHQIKCFGCKRYFDNVTIFSETYTQDYDNEKWFCVECFNKECYNKGHTQAIKEVLEIIDKLEIKPKDNSITRFTPYIYTEKLKAQIGEQK